jgi:hypothetical protein
MVTLFNQGRDPMLAPFPPSGHFRQQPHLEKAIHHFYLTASLLVPRSMVLIIHAKHPCPIRPSLHHRSPPPRSLSYPQVPPPALFQQLPIPEGLGEWFSINKSQTAWPKRCPPWKDRHSTHTLRLLCLTHLYSVGRRPISITRSLSRFMKTTLLPLACLH